MTNPTPAITGESVTSALEGLVECVTWLDASGFLPRCEDIALPDGSCRVCNAMQGAQVALASRPQAAPSGAPDELFDAANDLVWLSEWIDAGNAHRDAEAITWGRLAKLAEETGEVVAAYIGMTGQNPRKGVTHTLQDVYDELLDVAVTALGAAEHLAGHQGAVLDGLLMKIHLVAKRAREVSGA